MNEHFEKYNNLFDISQMFAAQPTDVRQTLNYIPNLQFVEGSLCSNKEIYCDWVVGDIWEELERPH